jgi:hypothetical protein
MAAEIVAQETITVGQAIVVEGQASGTHFGAVFEDDGETGYFYGLDLRREGQPIVDARHVYNVELVSDRETPAVVKILFSADGLKAALVINDFPHAVIDFGSQRAYCRTGFPPPTGAWAGHGAEWDDAALMLF